MNLKNLMKLGIVIFALIAMVSGASFAQISTVYVDVTNGSNTYTGANPTNSPAGTGPKASIAEGLAALANNGKLVLIAGDYNEAISISGNTLKSITIELRQLNGNNKVDVNGTFTYDVADGNLTITSTNGTEYINLLGNVVNLNAGKVNIVNSNNFVLPVTATINIKNSSGFTGAAPKKGTNVSLSYTGDGSFTAGPEAGYSDYGTGTITVNKTAGTKVTFPSAITKVAAITLTQGNADFGAAVTSEGAVTITAGDHAFAGALKLAGQLAVVAGTSTFSSIEFTANNDDALVVTDAAVTVSGAVIMKQGDIVNNGTKAVTFNGNVTLEYGDGAADANIAQILNASTGSVVFATPVVLNGNTALTADRNFVAAATMIWNNSTGTITLNGLTLNNPNNENAEGNFSAFVDVKNNAAGTVTIGTVTAALANTTAGHEKSYVSFRVRNEAAGTLSVAGNIRSDVVNASTGTLNLTGATTIGGVLNNAAAASGTINVNGNVDVTGVVTNAANKVIALGPNTLTLNNVANTFDEKSEVSGTGKIVVNAASVFTNTDAGAFVAKLPNVEVNATKSLTLNGGSYLINGYLLSNDALTVNSITEVTGDVTLNKTSVFAAALTVGGNLSINDDAALNAATLVKGNLSVADNTTISAATEVKGSTVFTAGTLEIAANTVFTVNNFTMSGGTLKTSTTNGVLAVKGNFNRTAGTYNVVGGTAEIRFIGTTTQAFNPGPLLSVDKLSFKNVDAHVVLGASPRVANNVTIDANAFVELGTLNIILNANNASIVNNGTYTAEGGGGVIFGGANTVQGGIEVTGQTISGTGTYSYLTVDVGTANFVTVNSAKVKWNGVLTLRSGDLKVGATFDFAPTGNSASIVRNVTASGSANGIVAGGANGTFNVDVPTDYDLTYTGALGAPATVTAGVSEFDLAHVKNLTVSTTGNILTLASTGAADVTVKGNMTLKGGAVFSLNAGAAFSVDIKGILTVERGADLAGGNAAEAFVVSTNGLTHQISGKVTSAHKFTVKGTGITVNGSTLVPAPAEVIAELANLYVDAAATATVKDIQKINGVVTTGATSTLSLGMADEKVVGGQITLGGTSFTLASAVEAQAGVAHNKGTLDFAGFDLTLTTAGAFTRANDASAVYASTGGYLVQKFATLALDLKGATIPYIRVDAATTLVDNVVVGEVLDHKSGSITSGGKNITINKTMTTVGGAADFTGAGKIILAGTIVTATADVAWSNLEVNSTGIATLASNNATAKTFVISGVLTQVKGELALGINNVSLTGAGEAYKRTEGTFTASTGQLIFAGVGAQTFVPATGWSLPNLTLNNAAGVVTAGKAFVVSGTLKLVKGDLSTTDAAGTLHIGNNAVIIRDASLSTLAQAPTFDGVANIEYVTAGGNTGKELPAAASVLKNLTINPGAENTITIITDATVNGTIYLKSGSFDEGTKALTLASGATIDRSGGIFVATKVPTVSSYNLIFSGNADMTTTDEDFQTGLANWTIATTGSKKTTLHKSLTLNGNFELNSADAGTLELNGKQLTFKGNVTITKGTIINTAAATTLTFAGANAQSFKVPAEGLVLPGSDTKVVNLELNNTSVGGVTLTDGNLTLGKDAIVIFKDGILKTDKIVKLDAPLFSKGQGFDRSGIGNNVSHIVGKVSKTLLNAGTITSSTEPRSEFPVGSDLMYRPVALTFNATNAGVVTIPNTTLTVAHVDAAPTGTVDLPIKDGVEAGKDVSRYPGFYWSIVSSNNVNTGIAFDMELGAAGFSQFDDVNNIRTIRRHGSIGDVTNQWLLQGTANSYDNEVNNGAPTIIAQGSTGGLRTGGAVFTLGLSSALTVVNAIPSQTLTAGGVVKKIVISNPQVFGGFTGDLVYTAQSSNNTVATVAVSGDTLKVTPKAVGNAVISVTATDDNNDFLTTQFNVTVNPVTQFAVTGKVTYDNAANTALKNVVVTLTPGGLKDTTDATGAFAFADVPNGTYTVTATTSAAWAGANSTDALLVAKNFAGLAGENLPLAGIRLQAANVNNSGAANNTDALLILSAFGKTAPGFALGEWLFSSPALTVAGANTTLNIKGIAVGDVNGSNTPTLAKTVALTTDGVQKVNPKEAFEVSVKAAGSMNVGAMSLRFNYPADLVDFVSSSSFGAKAENGVITLAWADLSGKESFDVKENGTLFTLKFQPKESFKAGSKLDITMDAVSEIANKDAKVVNAMLKIAAVEGFVPSEFALMQNYPNPFNPSTTVAYDLPVDARVNLVVFNSLGEEVATLVNDVQSAGQYKVEWSAKNMTSGIYFYRINVEAGDRSFVQTNKMILMK